MARLRVNGEAIDYRLAPDTLLLWALREESNLTGTKYGCDNKRCGACTVIIDGRAVKSCAVTLGQLEGAAVTTIEGLSADGSHPAQQAWLAEQATMCGFCEPGFILAIAARLEADDPARPIDNACACGAYVRIRRAIVRALQAAPPAERAQTDQFRLGSSAESHNSPR